ncbi:DUF3861 domain-containing protein [Dyadobacter frigoris]|uniref:DUF3861 domain-containing protein n=1 Tax=Dyadobacter frigoris TaxID=2576211 RepID=A0A4U6CV83_9BACT|nr:DUF3861 domain-containing protein [Dyadobacter frigoris]TKT87501.1 DUF3861 domain-containing protein [Dyadobacter frigoris]GLU52245.1 hypothetical protein Dfri01_17060 [Dyadobacter frigoris]
MEKRTNKYRLNLQYLSSTKEDAILPEPIEIDFENHDNIFAIIETLKEKNLFSEESQATEFAIGLKLFSEVMIKNKNTPLFEEFFPAFGTFMKKLKSS